MPGADVLEMDLWEAIYGRRSIRRFKTDENKRPLPVEDEKVEIILESSRWAPSTRNIQPWRFILIKSDAMRHLLADFGREMAHLIFGASAQIFFGHLWYVPKDRWTGIAEYTQTGVLWEYPKEANFIIVPCFNKGAWMDSYATVGSQDQGWPMSCGMALQNMWLTIYSLGLGAGFNAMPLSDARRRELFSELMNIPPSWVPLGAFAVGTPEYARMLGPSRASFEGLVFKEQWGERWTRMGFDESYEVGEIPAMNLSEAIHKRRSIRKFKQGAEVPRWKLEKILDVIKWCPNPENLNHFRFIIVQNEATKNMITEFNREFHDLAYRMGQFQITNGHLEALGIPKEDRLEHLEELRKVGWKYPNECDTIIIPCYSRTSWFEYPGSIAGGIDHIWAAATGAGLQNMWLATHALGLGGAFNVFPMSDIRRQEILCDHIGIPRSWEPLGAFCIGVPDENPKPPRRFPLSTLVFDEMWGNNYKPKFMKD